MEAEHQPGEQLPSAWSRVTSHAALLYILRAFLDWTLVGVSAAYCYLSLRARGGDGGAHTGLQ